jgi:hypothetical protein
VHLPGGKKLLLDTSQVNDKRLQVTFNGNLIPFILVKTDKGWKVDAKTIIAARKAAAAALAKAKSSEPAPSEQPPK